MDLASRKSVAGLIVESAFTKAFLVVTRIPIVPFDKFANIDKIKKVRSPVLVIHGTSDSVIPFSHGQQLFAAANEPKRFLWVEGADLDTLRPEGTEILSSPSPLNTENYFSAPEMVLSLSV